MRPQIERSICICSFWFLMLCFHFSWQWESFSCTVFVKKKHTVLHAHTRVLANKIEIYNFHEKRTGSVQQLNNSFRKGCTGEEITLGIRFQDFGKDYVFGNSYLALSSWDSSADLRICFCFCFLTSQVFSHAYTKARFYYPAETCLLLDYIWILDKMSGLEWILSIIKLTSSFYREKNKSHRDMTLSKMTPCCTGYSSQTKRNEL